MLVREVGWVPIKIKITVLKTMSLVCIGWGVPPTTISACHAGFASMGGAPIRVSGSEFHSRIERRFVVIDAREYGSRKRWL